MCSIKFLPTIPESLASPLGQRSEREFSNSAGEARAPAARMTVFARNSRRRPRQEQTTRGTAVRSASKNVAAHSVNRCAPCCSSAGVRHIRAASFLQPNAQMYAEHVLQPGTCSAALCNLYGGRPRAAKASENSAFPAASGGGGRRAAPSSLERRGSEVPRTR